MSDFLSRTKFISKRIVFAALLGSTILGFIAIQRNETINALWFIAAALCVYTIGYRFYAAWISAKILILDPTRATPSERFNDGQDFIPTNKWITFGHHFAAIAGPGPLIGPTLAAQFGYLPGTLWILLGSVFAGAVQDMLVLFFSTRRNGKSLGQIARDELGKVAGLAASIGTLMIVIILISVLGLVVVKAMKNSPWATFTVFSTIPTAILVGLYLRYLRPEKIFEASLIGLTLILAGVFGGEYIANNNLLSGYFNLNGEWLAIAIIIYGFLAATLPVWLLLAPRDYLSTYLKLGTIFLLIIAVVILRPEIQMPAMTKFIDGSGPIFGGKVFPFMFITIACGAISGFHSLIASGTTPKILANERDIRFIGYGSMLLESLVAIIALIAACILDPGLFFAINSPASIVGSNINDVCQTISSWGFTISPETIQNISKSVGEETLLGRTGGAPSLAVGMAVIFAKVFGDNLLGIWYHFAIMFESVFILTTLDAGTRVARFMLQDLLGNFYEPLGKHSSLWSNVLSSGLIVASWGYFLYIGVIDPNGGVNLLWPIFGIANQMLASIALCICTCILAKTKNKNYIWISFLPLLFLITVTSFATLEKFLSPDPRISFGDQPVLIGLTLVFIVCLWIVFGYTLNILYKAYKGCRLNSTESEYIVTKLKSSQEQSLLSIFTKKKNYNEINRCC